MSPTNPILPLLAVSPVRNEAHTLERTIASMVAQTRRPMRWIIIDDGSTDRTAEIARAAAEEHEWIQLVRRADRGFRKLGDGVIEAFDEGVAAVDESWEYVAKIDADIEFPPDYLAVLMEYFGDDRKLGAASGKVFLATEDGEVENFMIDEMVAGQFKVYRREAFEAIGGFVREVMWDGIDFHRARMEGWKTRSIADPRLHITELRPMGASDRSIFRGRMRWGRGQWFMGSWMPYVVASGLFRMRERPYVIGGLLIVVGYFWAALRGDRRYDDMRFRQGLHRWQKERLRGFFRGRGVR
ncbi:MAG: glycosyltransferase family 2 protein [bacterium]|nr:glycosyltransferase family 2 protein [bacterium]